MKLYQQEKSQLIHREATRGTLTRNHLREGLLTQTYYQSILWPFMIEYNLGRVVRLHNLSPEEGLRSM